MAKSERTGFLQVKGGVNGWVNPTLEQVGKLVGSSEAEFTPLLGELKQAGVCSLEEGTGIIFSRRMVRDHAAYEQACEYGKRGGNPRIIGVKGRVKGRVNLSRQPSLASSISILPLASGLDPEALAIYEAYPRRVARAHALKAIKAALAKKPSAHLLDATRAFASATEGWPADRRQFIPYPASWFNSESYDDDRTAWAYIPKDTTVPWQRRTSTDEDHAKGF